MNFHRSFVAFLVVVLLLVGCQAKNTQPTEIPAGSYPQPGSDAIYPAPGSESSYPAPETTDNTEYPGSSGNITATWEMAQAFLTNGEVSRVVLLANLEFQLFLKDGRVINSVEPEQDAVKNAIESCGGVCKDIPVDQG